MKVLKSSPAVYNNHAGSGPCEPDEKSRTFFSDLQRLCYYGEFKLTNNNYLRAIEIYGVITFTLNTTTKRVLLQIFTFKHMRSLYCIFSILKGPVGSTGARNIGNGPHH